MELKKDDKVKCTRSGVIGRVVKLGGRTSKIRIPIFGTRSSTVKQIPNRYLERR